jgi:hypothetical protein
MNRNQPGLWIPAIVIPIVAASLAIFIAWGISRIALSYSQPAPATSTAQYDLTGQTIAEFKAIVPSTTLWSAFSYQVTHDNSDIVFKKGVHYIIIAYETPTSTNTERGETNLYWPASMDNSDENVPAPTSTEWSCPAIEMCKELLGEHCGGVSGVQTFTLEIPASQTPESEGYSDCTQIK